MFSLQKLILNLCLIQLQIKFKIDIKNSKMRNEGIIIK